MRLRMKVAYDGTDFCGWARQPTLRSVQGVLEQALDRALRLPVGTLRVACGGRTDAGVHARGQMCHADVPSGVLADAAGQLQRRLNAGLPDDVRVLALDRAPEGFDARWSAHARRYAYRISDGAHGASDPLTRRFVLAHASRLDLEALNAASSMLLGERDFAAFCRRRDGASTVRTLERMAWHRDEAGIAVLDIEADAFCHSMVRSLVGAMIPVGDGRWPASRPAEMLVAAASAGARMPGITVAPAHGLTLEQILYPDDHLLGSQAMRAKRFRG